MSSPDPLTEVQAACAALEAAYQRAADAIEAEPPDAAFARAGELAGMLSGTQLRLSGAVAQLRARSAGRIWDSERLSLAALADRIGVSKARADQLIRSVKKQQGEENP